MANETKIEQLLALRNDLLTRINRLECSKDFATCVIEFNCRYSLFLKKEVDLINDKMVSAYGKKTTKKNA